MSIFQEKSVTNASVAIVFHSRYGHTARQAMAVKEGVGRAAGATGFLVACEDAPARWDELALADAIIFGAPTYMAGVSAEFKAFQEATSSAVMFRGFLWKDKIAAGFTNSGAHAGDKLSTLVQLALFAAQHGMHWVNLGLPPANNSTTGSAEDLNRLGFWLGAGAQSNTDQGPEAAPPEADLATARHLGWRVADAALQFARGRIASSGRDCQDLQDDKINL
ncbi:flavodoxin family protein [Burkholderia sp. BCC0405]|uniref:flavodoxin family protein n=1 Tax=Burkholderia sp. BCC0405 TaxID=2676298 RepID=UPI00158CB954|nr:flavodoxin family protein [Burkholderia sp. BCC0405]